MYFISNGFRVCGRMSNLWSLAPFIYIEKQLVYINLLSGSLSFLQVNTKWIYKGWLWRQVVKQMSYLGTGKGLCLCNLFDYDYNSHVYRIFYNVSFRKIRKHIWLNEVPFYLRELKLVCYLIKLVNNLNVMF